MIERTKKEAMIRDKIEKGELMPTRRTIGHRRYKEKLPEFKELDTDMPTAKNIEASIEPLKYFLFTTGTCTMAFSEKAILSLTQLLSPALEATCPKSSSTTTTTEAGPAKLRS